MTERERSGRLARTLAELAFGFLAVHGALNLGIRTEARTSVKVFIGLAAGTFAVVIIGRRLIGRAPSRR